jgi:hypothetical protein|tara:strand:+ start:605 stop:853 length:249 start_codon:yes stop_codon:yes gene_type:complete
MTAKPLAMPVKVKAHVRAKDLLLYRLRHVLTSVANAEMTGVAALLLPICLTVMASMFAAVTTIARQLAMHVRVRLHVKDKVL